MEPHWFTRTVCTALLIAAGTACALSQVVITQGDLETLAGKFQVSYPALDATGFDLTVAGTNKRWDLSGYSFDATPDLRLTHLVFPPPGAPDVGNPAFASANYAIKSESPRSISWQYAKVSAAGVEVVGNIDTASISLVPGLKIVGPFPVAYGNTWTSISTLSSPDIPSGITVTMAANGSIDSWGMMTLPGVGGTSLTKNVLRLRLLQTTTIKLGIFTLLEFSSLSYQWLGSPSDGQFYIATASTDSVGGLETLSYYTPFNVGPPPVSVASGEDVLPESPALLPNYPNPFNPTTTVPFSILDDGPVSLTAYNSLGQQVATLVNGNLPAGSYTVTFDGGRLPSGLYVLKLETGGSLSARKIMLLR
jgi:hypothetical protein